MSGASNGGIVPLVGDSECWHVIERLRLVELLRRAHEGEDPDLLYIEEYVNAERDEVEADG